MLPSEADPVEHELLRRRVVILRGTVDDELASQTASRLIALDAGGVEPIDVHLTSEGGSLDAAFALADSMAMIASPVHVTCLGRVEGAALAVLAAGAVRRSAPHTTFRLSLPTDAAAGTARHLELWVRQHEDRTRQFVACIARRAHLPFEHVEADLDLGRFLNAEEALRYGLLDEIWPAK